MSNGTEIRTVPDFTAEEISGETRAPMCGKGLHPRIPENRRSVKRDGVPATVCLLCHRDAQQAYKDRNVAKGLTKQGKRRDTTRYDIGKGVVTHGFARNGSRHYLYSTWVGMKDRCRRRRHPAYHRYGGRGICVWPDWDRSFPAFLSYVLENLGERPEGHSLDRIDPDGNYEPGNIRWADALTQNRNRGSR